MDTNCGTYKVSKLKNSTNRPLPCPIYKTIYGRPSRMVELHIHMGSLTLYKENSRVYKQYWWMKFQLSVYTLWKFDIYNTITTPYPTRSIILSWIRYASRQISFYKFNKFIIVQKRTIVIESILTKRKLRHYPYSLDQMTSKCTTNL